MNAHSTLMLSKKTPVGATTSMMASGTSSPASASCFGQWHCSAITVRSAEFGLHASSLWWRPSEKTDA
ncbi:MAG: hypothetical protein HOC43_01700 [Planctomycetes bacterium]|nr:hypothetical protein [Planctomycetota bacterium]